MKCSPFKCKFYPFFYETIISIYGSNYLLYFLNELLVQKTTRIFFYCSFKNWIYYVYCCTGRMFTFIFGMTEFDGKKTTWSYFWKNIYAFFSKRDITSDIYRVSRPWIINFIIFIEIKISKSNLPYFEIYIYWII
jgi:hypothetical protein